VRSPGLYSRFFKRALDLVFAVVLLIMLSWLLGLVMLIYIFSIGRPIFFRQARIGKGERVFSIIKFRTLTDGSGDLSSRKFPFGTFLRATSIDELPQLINVIKGEMSLIGPRPLPIEYLHLFTGVQRMRHSVRPGITGLAQVNGRTEITWEKKFDLDKHYIQEMSLSLDIKIAIRTIVVLLSFRRDESLKEKPFTGEL
jgi:lipopolysaccharide/colanic/teichoic acid biosynthesis glycosyltransferase